MSKKHTKTCLKNQTIDYVTQMKEKYRDLGIQEKIWNESVNDRTLKEEYILRELNKNRPYPKKFDIAVPANTHCGDSSKVE